MRTPRNKGLQKLFFLFASCMFLILIGRGVFDAFTTPNIGFTASLNCVVTDIDPDGAAFAAGMEINDRIVEINGESIESGNRIAALGRNIQIGQNVIYLVRKPDGKTLTLSLKLKSPTRKKNRYIIFNAISSLFLLFLATFLYLRNPEYFSVKLFYFLNLFYLFFKMDHPRWQDEILARIYQEVYLFSFFLIPAVFVHFCARFPKPNNFLNRKASRIFWVYALPLVLFIPAALTYWIHYDDFKTAGLITKIILYQGLILWTGFLIAGCLMMINSFLSIRSRELSKRCSIVFYTIILAVAPYIIAGFMEKFLHRSYVYDIVGLILFLPFPITLAWTLDFKE